MTNQTAREAATLAAREDNKAHAALEVARAHADECEIGNDRGIAEMDDLIRALILTVRKANQATLAAERAQEAASSIVSGLPDRNHDAQTDADEAAASATEAALETWGKVGDINDIIAELRQRLIHEIAEVADRNVIKRAEADRNIEMANQVEEGNQ